MFFSRTAGLHVHAEDEVQQDFFVLKGEALLLVAGEERPLQAWDFFHCPAGTEHVTSAQATALVGPGCRATTGGGVRYLESELAHARCRCRA